MIEALLKANGFHEADVFLNQPHIHNELVEVADRAALSTRSPLAAEARSARALLDKRDQAISPLGSLGSRGDT